MSKNTLLASALALLACSAQAQSTTHPTYMERAVIQRTDSAVSIVANAPTPLQQAIAAIRDEYGWRIDWEQAPAYSRFDVVDDTGPKWRAAHPDAKGVTRSAGGRFTSAFQASLTSSEADVLTKVLQDYNATDNPGKYILIAGEDGHYAIVGTQVRDEAGRLQPVTPLLETPLTIDIQARNVYDTVRTIVAALSAATGKKVIIMSVPNNLFRDTQVTLGGKNVPARNFLQQALDSTHRPLQYDFGYDPDVPVYILNVSVARVSH